MSPPLPSLRVRRWLPLAWSAAALLLAAHFFTPAAAVLDASLDASNYASYAAFTAQGRQFGTAVVPMAGPLGFVMYGWVYGGDLYVTRFVLEFLTKLVFAALVLWFFHRARRGPARWLWLAANLFLPIAAGELAYDLPILYAAVFVLLARPRGALLAAVAALLAFLALSKGTQLVFTVAVLSLLAGHTAWRRAWRDLVTLLGGYTVTLLALWCLARQDPRHLPAYVRNLFELSSGYNGAMALPESAFTFATGLSAWLTLLAGVALLLLPHRRSPTVVAGALLLAGFAFLQWKHGFVRADGHVFLFFYYAVIGSLTALLFDPAEGGAGPLGPPPSPPSSALPHRLRALLCAATAVLAFFSTGGNPLHRWRDQAAFFAQHVAENLRQFAHPLAHRRDLEARLAASRERLALPEVAAQAGSASIDFFGYELGYLPLNRLNYQPRPVGGGAFSVFTPRLQQLNERHLASVARPEFFLLKLQTVDHHFVAQDDGTTLLALLHRYRPVVAERDTLLLRADPAAHVPGLRRLTRQSFRLGDRLDLPAVAADELVLASLELPSSLAGSLRGALYKPALVSLHFTTGDSADAVIATRIVPSMTTRPFLLSPYLETTADVVGLYSPAGAAGRPVRQLWLNAAPAWAVAADRCAITFYAQRGPLPVAAATSAALADALLQPFANRPPSAIASHHAQLRHVDGRLVQIVEPPGQIEFTLRGDERELLFDYGLDPESYQRGTTDGADFIVDLVLPGSAPEQLFISRREPLSLPADRGRHHAQVWLPILPPGAKLLLRSGAGRFGVGEWDWTYFDNIRLHSGALRVEQFPGFAVAPIEAHGVWTRLTKLGDDDVLMLNAPGRLVFALTGRERVLHFSGGLLPGATTQGNSDGAEFLVELASPGAPAQLLHRRWLQPKTVPADRGPQAFAIPLPPALPAGTRIVVRTDPGPHGDAGWDWSYLAHLRFE